jgi:hypothetical protein
VVSIAAAIPFIGEVQFVPEAIEYSKGDGQAYAKNPGKVPHRSNPDF